MIRRLRQNAWNWLPAFLEVAEVESVARASKNLGVTPAAVSRTLGLLEDAVGQQLFNRVGRSLALNRAGAALRDSLRAAVASIDNGFVDALGDPFVGALRVASLGVLSEHVVMPALIELKTRHPGLVPEHINMRAAEANHALVRGQVDVAFYYEDLAVDDVVVERIGSLGASVYCGVGHPLFEQGRVTRARLLEHAFSVPQVGDTGRIMDGWPPEIPREVGMRITMLRSNLQVCRSGVLLTVLPDITAEPDVARGVLRRLSAVRLPSIEVFAAHHVSARPQGRARSLIEEVRALVASATPKRARSRGAAASGKRRSPRRGTSRSSTGSARGD